MLCSAGGHAKEGILRFAWVVSDDQLPTDGNVVVVVVVLLLVMTANNLAARCGGVCLMIG
jgi:hypothetical protein